MATSPTDRCNVAHRRFVRKHSRSITPQVVILIGIILMLRDLIFDTGRYDFCILTRSPIITHDQSISTMARTRHPRFFVTNREGHVIFRSYVGDEYIGPDTVLTQFAQLLAETDPANSTTRRARHRLETIMHLRASANTTLAAKPYLLSLDPWRYQSLSTQGFTATLTLDATGQVTDVISTAPELPYILKSPFQSDVADWLFLPSATNGKGRSCTVKIPIDI